jgi:serine/threonine protein kinase
MAHPDAHAYPGKVFGGKWEVGEYLGDGNFSIVFKGLDILNGSDCAIKVLSITRSTAENLVEFERDAQLLTRLSSSSNVIDLLGAGKYRMEVQAAQTGLEIPLEVSYMVLERADGDLAQLLVNRKAIEWEDRLALFRDVAKGVHQMHLQYLVNRDLKGDNVLVMRVGGRAVAKITDLGRGRDTKEPSLFPGIAYELGRGDLRFAPPEFLWGLGSDDAEAMRQGDLYLLGSVLFEIVTGQGLSGLIMGNPLRVAESKRTLSDSARRADFTSTYRALQRDHEAAYTVFEGELPVAIRTDAVALLRQLTNVDPVQREPRYVRGLASSWDLQWVLRRIDRILLRLRIDKRRSSKLPWKQKGPRTS